LNDRVEQVYGPSAAPHTHCELTHCLSHGNCDTNPQPDAWKGNSLISHVLARDHFWRWN